MFIGVKNVAHAEDIIFDSAVDFGLNPVTGVTDLEIVGEFTGKLPHFYYAASDVVLHSFNEEFTNVTHADGLTFDNNPGCMIIIPEKVAIGSHLRLKVDAMNTKDSGRLAVTVGSAATSYLDLGAIGVWFNDIAINITVPNERRVWVGAEYISYTDHRLTIKNVRVCGSLVQPVLSW